MKILLIILSLGTIALAETTIQINLPGVSYGTQPNPTVIWVGIPDRTPASQVVVVPAKPVQEKPVPYNPKDYWHRPD